MVSGDTSQLGGPIKIAKISGQVLEFGILAFVSTDGLHLNKSWFN